MGQRVRIFHCEKWHGLGESRKRSDWLIKNQCRLPWKKRWQMERPVRMGYKLSGVECGFMQNVFTRVCARTYVVARTWGNFWYMARLSRSPIYTVATGQRRRMEIVFEESPFFWKFTLDFKRHRWLAYALDVAPMFVFESPRCSHFHLSLYYTYVFQLSVSLHLIIYIE